MPRLFDTCYHDKPIVFKFSSAQVVGQGKGDARAGTRNASVVVSESVVAASHRTRHTQEPSGM